MKCRLLIPIPRIDINRIIEYHSSLTGVKIDWNANDSYIVGFCVQSLTQIRREI